MARTQNNTKVSWSWPPRTTEVTDVNKPLQDVNYISPEIANVNSLRAGRESYGESAIGWVQVHRHENVFTVLGVIAPEHNVTSKNCIVEVKIDIERYEIVSAICKSCVAHQGGCKHHIAFIGWIHRRSEEPAKTEVECYWKKIFLSQVGTTTKFIEARNFVNNKRKNGKGSGKVIKLRKKETPSGSFLKEVIPQIFNYFQEHDEWFQNLDLHNLMQLFQRSFPAGSPEQFRVFCKTNMKNENCKIAAAKTASQSECGHWFKLRYGRITASKLFEVSRCQSKSGSLVDLMLGAKLIQSPAMERGIRLEKETFLSLGLHQME
ncbi:Uncharacterized protein APZ42_033641 [Daphnia magna]|uniref:SWIM-type domain-containing protein n=1 Tax=Daphnia magna TaxID=35525 RepID=A0A164KWR3_9CRUS|nr:Uncharacterized protein APZ42_033641 [Daphnia magna]